MIVFSVIIPCYNHGQFINKAIESVLEYPFQNEVEIIVVNDGSDDPSTIQTLSLLKGENLTILNQVNQGLSSARNNGISIASGKYILLLDSDNYISPQFLISAKHIFEKKPSFSILYTNKYVFKTNNNSFKKTKVGKFDVSLLIYGNYIDACAIVRKEVFDKIGGYDQEMKSGYEDWEFWIRAASNNLQFYHIPKFLFFYRDEENSMSKDSNKKRHSIIKYVFLKHIDFIIGIIIDNRIRQSYLKRKPLKYGFKELLNGLIAQD